MTDVKPRTTVVAVELDPSEAAYVVERIRAEGLADRIEFHSHPRPLSDADGELLKAAEVLSVFIYSTVTSDIVSACPNLKLISTRSTGFDHIDMVACRDRSIQVCNVPLYGENTVAEHTFALILALSRNVHKAYVRTLQGNFSLEGLRGFDLKGKTLGVVGAGHIGLHVIKMAKGFSMDVLAYDVHQNHFLAEVLNFHYADLETLLGSSDIISLHAPYNNHTHHLINRENVSNIKRGALLINTARGGLVDTEALAQALDDGVLGGAALDVLEGEDLIKDEVEAVTKDVNVAKLKTLVLNHQLLHRENVVITPHIAFDSVEAHERILDTTVRNIRLYLDGAPKNLVHI